jgi:hypothetical protein
MRILSQEGVRVLGKWGYGWHGGADGRLVFLHYLAARDLRYGVLLRLSF